MPSSTDRIERDIHINAPLSIVWDALTNHQEFGQWFRVNLTSPFKVGQITKGNITYPGYEHLIMAVKTIEISPKTRFSFEWHPYAIDPKVNYDDEPPTLVLFLLKEQSGGVHLTVIESGFDNIPAHRRDEAFRMNSGGWTEQIKNIATYAQNKA